MHLLADSPEHRRIIDGERACDAVAAIGDPEEVAAWAHRYALLADPTRLALLLGIHHAGPIAVSDLAAAVDRSDTAVSQALRLLRSEHVVTAHREGRVVRYTLKDPLLGELLTRVRPEPVGHRHPPA
jgi:DNA-binding transcriptional ArsR family regulator